MAYRKSYVSRDDEGVVHLSWLKSLMQLLVFCCGRDRHQPCSRGLGIHYQDSLLEVG